MDRRVALTVAFVLLVGLAGCSALIGGDEGETPTPDTPTETPEENVPEADPGSDGGEGPDVAYPAGYGPGGVEAPDEAVSSHISGLVGYGNYIFSYDSTEEFDGQMNFTTIQYAVDNEEEVAYNFVDNGSLSRVSYFENDREYIKWESGGNVAYNSRDSEFDGGAFTGLQLVGPLLYNVDYLDAEVIESDEGTFYRYVSDEVTNPGAILRSDFDENRIESFNVSIVVDENGVVRNGRFTVSVDDDNIKVLMGVNEIGSVNLDRPEWFEEADDS